MKGSHSGSYQNDSIEQNNNNASDMSSFRKSDSEDEIPEIEGVTPDQQFGAAKTQFFDLNKENQLSGTEEKG